MQYIDNMNKSGHCTEYDHFACFRQSHRLIVEKVSSMIAEKKGRGLEHYLRQQINLRKQQGLNIIV